MKRVRALAAVGAACALLIPAGPLRAQSAPADPQTIFAAARKAWTLDYPRYAQYTVAVRYRKGAATIRRHYASAADLRRSIVFARTFSGEEIADPPAPYGANIALFGMTVSKLEKIDPIGPLALAANYDFGIAGIPQHTTVVSSGSDMDRASSIPIIGRTGVLARDYDVRLIDDDAAAYHLGLTPLREPQRFRLRELWVERATFATLRARIDGNFDRKPLTGVPWLIEFSSIGGARFIARETALQPIDYGKAGVLDDVTITFEDLTAVAFIPAYVRFAINSGTDRVAEP